MKDGALVYTGPESLLRPLGSSFVVVVKGRRPTDTDQLPSEHTFAHTTGVVTTDKQIQETIGELEMRLHRHVSLTTENCGVQEINAIMCQFMRKLEGRTLINPI